MEVVKRAVDADPTPGQFVLTGSVRTELTHEMWAGTGRIVRMAMQESRLPEKSAYRMLPP